ncbi:MAG: FAD-binding oxidoreductase [Bacteroidia bacterium]|nr:FAD-binding oxidoreductase [Bacteroidia bacterium]
MKVNYIIVGCGLAGISFAEVLRRANKSYVVIEDNSQRSSSVAGGIYNPVILKRFSAVWKAQEQLDVLRPFYQGLEELLNVKLDHKIELRRLFSSIEEQNNWFLACDNSKLHGFLDPNIIGSSFEGINDTFGYGKVLQAGRIDTALLITNFRKYLESNNAIIKASFKHAALETHQDGIAYKNIKADYIIFAEGFGLNSNPFFNDLPLNGTKGELITIHAPELQLDVVIKSSVFVIPLGNDIYRIGATYERNDKTNVPSEAGKDELVTKLNKVLKCKYTIVDHVAGIRPTVRDRRPLVGQHGTHKHMYVLNGLGTRGVMIGPYVATALFEYIERGTVLDPELDIRRFQT